MRRAFQPAAVLLGLAVHAAMEVNWVDPAIILAPAGRAVREALAAR